MTLSEKRIVGTIFLLNGRCRSIFAAEAGVIFILLGSALLGLNNRQADLEGPKDGAEAFPSS